MPASRVPASVDHLRVLWLLVVHAARRPAVRALDPAVADPDALGARAGCGAGIGRRSPGRSPSRPAPDAAAWAGRTVFVVAGEASGDEIAARVVEAMRRRCPRPRVRGYAGPATAAAGARLDTTYVATPWSASPR